ncbi:hypothetical protein EYC84_006551 [Monilinia fructicola]|uniref:Uncharacterized protein n=1 Tax=Monilinia fructicola TaxID=38448 RepID=A0A5M9K882_MONFR|nr:hypothetical protein EYC84_006551 [Monilinia fructicola]
MGPDFKPPAYRSLFLLCAWRMRWFLDLSKAIRDHLVLCNVFFKYVHDDAHHEKPYTQHINSGPDVSRQITLQLNADQCERLFFQPTSAKGDFTKHLGNPTLLSLLGFLIPFSSIVFSLLHCQGSSRNSHCCNLRSPLHTYLGFLCASLRTNVPFVIVFLTWIFDLASFPSGYYSLCFNLTVAGVEHATYCFTIARGFGLVTIVVGWY